MEGPICQVCQAKRATVSFSCWRSDRFLDRTFVCSECAPTFERLFYGSSGRLSKLVMNAAVDRARTAGIDPARDCPGCGMTLMKILTDGMVGCEICYERFSEELAPAVESIQGWGAHVGKLPIG